MQSVVSTQLRIIVGTSATSRPRQQNKRSLVSRVNSSSGTSSTSSSSSSSDEEKAQFMLTEYGHPWIENEESAMRLLEYLRTKEKREFNLEKARVVIAQIRETHEKGIATEEARKANPFKLPKTFPGFLGILERSSDKIWANAWLLFIIYSTAISLLLSTWYLRVIWNYYATCASSSFSRTTAFSSSYFFWAIWPSRNIAFNWSSKPSVFNTATHET